MSCQAGSRGAPSSSADLPCAYTLETEVEMNHASKLPATPAPACLLATFALLLGCGGSSTPASPSKDAGPGSSSGGSNPPPDSTDEAGTSPADAGSGAMPSEGGLPPGEGGTSPSPCAPTIPNVPW